jgi:hypothetical protein
MVEPWISFEWRGWQWPLFQFYRIGVTRVFDVGPIVAFVRGSK